MVKDNILKLTLITFVKETLNNNFSYLDFIYHLEWSYSVVKAHGVVQDLHLLRVTFSVCCVTIRLKYFVTT